MLHGSDDMMQDNMRVVGFKDHSEEFQTDQNTSLRKKKLEVPLPDLHYIRIHVATGIMHMRAVGKFF
jgi:hypothetical protein